MRSEKNQPPLELEYAVERQGARWRTPAAFTLAILGGPAASYGLSMSGFGLFPAWFVLSLVPPTILCLVATSHYVWVSVLYVSGMMIPLLVLTLVAPGGCIVHPRQQFGVLVFLAIMTALSIGIAFVLARAVRRGRSSPN